MLEKFALAFEKSFQGYTIKDYIRLVIIIGAYVLIRKNYVFWRGRKHTQDQIDEDNLRAQEQRDQALKDEKAKFEESGEASTSTNFAWGTSAKSRVTKRRKNFESQTRREAEMKQDDSDEDIADLLKD